MKSLHRVAFIGNSLPRRCGIATFTTDLQLAIAAAPDGIETSIVAMNDGGRDYAYPPSVGFTVRDENIDDYLRAADFLNAAASTSFRCSTNSAFSAARPAAISWRCWPG